jgi:hypothetical protein
MVRGRIAPKEVVEKHRKVNYDRTVLSEKEFYEKYPEQKEIDLDMDRLEKELLEENRLRDLKKSKSKRKSKVDVAVSHLQKLDVLDYSSTDLKNARI